MLKVPHGVSPDAVAPEAQASWLDEVPNVPVVAPLAPAPTDSPAPSSGNFLDEIPDALSPIQKSYQAAAPTDADRNADVVKYSQQTALDPQYIDHNLDQAKQAANAPSPSAFDAMEKDYPGSTKFYSKPENMAVAHDDIPNVMKHEELINNASVLQNIYKSGQAAWQNSIAGLFTRQNMPDVQAPDSTAYRVLSGAGTMLLDFPAYLAGGAIGATADAPIGAAAGAVAGSVAPGFGNLIGAGVGGAVGAFAGGSMGTFAFPAALRQAITDHIQNGDVKDTSDLISRTLDISKAAAKGAAIGLFTGGAGATAEALGAGVLTKLGAEAIAMPTASAALEGRLPTAPELTDSALLMGLMHASGSGIEAGVGKVNEIHQIMIDDQQNQQAKSFLNALADTTKDSKLRQRLPDAWRQQVEDLTKDGPVENVYLNHDEFQRYFQSKSMDPEAVANELNAGDSFREAQQTGGLVKIPMVDFLDKLVDRNNYQGLMNDVKFDPDQMSSREIMAKRQEIKAGIDEMAKNPGKGLPDQEEDNSVPASGDKPVADSEMPGAESADQAASDSGKAVVLDVAEQLKAIDQDPRQAVLYKGFDVLGKRAGIDPLELYNRYKLRIGNGQEDPNAPDVFDEAIAAYNKKESPTDLSPEERQILQDSKVQAKSEVMELAKRAIHNISDISPDDVAEAFGLPKKEVRLLAKGSKRQGKLRGAYSKEEIFAAAKQSDDKSFNQGGDRTLGQFTVGKNRQMNIDLLAGADKSTFIHETGHLYTEVLGDLHDHINAIPEEQRTPEQHQLSSDYKTILDWVGAKDRSEIGTEQHEQIARGFESYLMEGKAPSAGLRAAFSRFRDWLFSVYKNSDALRVKLTPEVREVMDRLLATDDEIKNAAKLAGYEPIDTSEMSKEVAAKIKNLQDRARDQATEKLLKPQMDELKEKNKAIYEEHKAKATAEAQAEVENLPLFSAIKSLKEHGNPFTLADKGMAGELTPALSSQFEATAEVHGFPDGESMARAIQDSAANNTYASEVRARVDAKMEPFAHLMDTGKIRDMAIEAIHSDQSSELLALEQQALTGLVKKAEIANEATKRNRVEAKVTADAAKEFAREALAAKPIKEAGKARIYITAERNAAVRAAKAIASGDYEAAAKAKLEQLNNHALAAEAMRNREEITGILNSVRKYANRGGDLMGMSYGFARQLDQILGRYDLSRPRTEDIANLTKIAQDLLSKGEDPAEVTNRTGLMQDQSGKLVPEKISDFVSRVNDNSYALSLPDSIMAEASKSYRDIPLSELREMGDSVKTIAHIGKNYNRLLGQFDKIDIREAATTFRKSIEKNFGSKYAEDMLPGSKHATKTAELMETLSRLPDALTRTLDTILTTCHKFDGLEEGPAKEYIYRPFADAQARKTVRLGTAMEEMGSIFAKHYTPEEFSKYKDTRINVDGRNYTKEQVLSMALNWGNEGNRDRVMRGFGFDEAKMQQFFSHLGAKDWNFAQDTWNHIDKYWPEISKLEMEVNGSEPGKVKALPFENEHGKFDGGYYPIAYDSEKSADAFQNNQSKDATYKQYSTAKAATEDGHTEARASQVTRPIRLSLDVLANHHEDVIHDLEFRKAVIDANRFLSMPDTKTAITNAIGVKGYAGFQDWLKSVAGGNSEPLSAWDKAAQWFRFKTTFFNMAYRFALAPKIALDNLVNVSQEVGVSGVARSLKNYYMGESGMHETVVEKSPFMKQRAEHLDRDMSDINDKYRGTEQSSFRKYAFFVHAYIDQGMSFPLWSDVYRSGMSDHGEEKLAISQADEAVKRTFMSGGSVDQAAAMRGGEIKKAMTTAYGYQSMMWNRFSQQAFKATSEWGQGNHLAAAAIAARATVYSFAMPAIITALTREFMHNSSNQNPEDRNKRMVASALEEATPLKFIPVVRDMQSYAIRQALGEKSGDLHFTPLEEAAQNIIQPTIQGLRALNGERLPNKFGEKSANALSLVAGVPKEMNDIVFNFLDWQHGNGELTWRDTMTRLAKK